MKQRPAHETAVVRADEPVVGESAITSQNVDKPKVVKKDKLIFDLREKGVRVHDLSIGAGEVLVNKKMVPRLCLTILSSYSYHSRLGSSCLCRSHCRQKGAVRKGVAHIQAG